MSRGRDEGIATCRGDTESQKKYRKCATTISPFCRLTWAHGGGVALLSTVGGMGAGGGLGTGGPPNTYRTPEQGIQSAVRGGDKARCQPILAALSPPCRDLSVALPARPALVDAGKASQVGDLATKRPHWKYDNWITG